jgi:hypothetical protein
VEPDWTIFNIVLKAFVTDVNCLLNEAFPLLKLRGLKVDGAMSLALFEQIPELVSSSLSIA